ncbi:MAG: hypothetical protein IPK26_00410 [Planctomycetes bacterium]|nr:hypothetical protein [Planctomycetota bacterium]
MTSFAKRSLFALPILFAGAAVPAQMTANWSLSYGPADFGGSITAALYSRRTSLDSLGSVELASGGSLIQRIRIFGSSVETNAVLANYSVRKQYAGEVARITQWSLTKTGSFVRRICGLTWSTSATTNSTITAVCDPGRAFGSAGVSAAIDVFGYSIGVRANASVGLTYALTPSLILPSLALPLQPLTAGLTGYARGSATGSASAWLAVAVPLVTVSAGVSTNMVFANTRADLNATASVSYLGHTSLGGALTIAVNPMAIAMTAIARVSTVLGVVERRQPIVNWSAGSRNVTIPIQ